MKWHIDADGVFSIDPEENELVSIILRDLLQEMELDPGLNKPVSVEEAAEVLAYMQFLSMQSSTRPLAIASERKVIPGQITDPDDLGIGMEVCCYKADGRITEVMLIVDIDYQEQRFYAVTIDAPRYYQVEQPFAQKQSFADNNLVPYSGRLEGWNQANFLIRSAQQQLEPEEVERILNTYRRQTS